MAFTMSLDSVSLERVRPICERHMAMRKALLSVPSLPSNADPDEFVRFGSFWLKRGLLPLAVETRYVMTPSVQSKLSDLARVILTRRYPVLIQGPTSSGKTSAIEFLARQTGHRFVRINNHEHTDIQEYLGTYVTDPQTGNLIFQEGLLVTAVRQGHWIVLDELNLAPTDVLEALNRLLDDNRELVIPETQEVVRPHPNFMLFATQNPPALYAGRKVLSRAFRNRFLEVHFDDVPKEELETILCQRCEIAPSYAKRIVEVSEELRHRRQASRVFEAKSSFATLRDLFRWAERGAIGYQQLADYGYMLLAERARQSDDKSVIKTVIEQVMKVIIEPKSLYTTLPFKSIPESSMVWTRAMQRLFTLVAVALANNEPVLLVGETGCGKTSVCDVIARAFDQQLVAVNCHQNLETADLIGSQRPVRNRKERRAKVQAMLSSYIQSSDEAMDEQLIAGVSDNTDADFCRREIRALSSLFEWSDGPLVNAMVKGDLLLLDEVSLADDSVLERLNSVLEPSRTLVLAEKGGIDIEAATVIADPAFHVVATMNPGGDFGKKELSPALRNRFTEIWVPPLDDRDDLLQIIGHTWTDSQLVPCGPAILDFLRWLHSRTGDTGGLGLRDVLSWSKFVDQMAHENAMALSIAFQHGGMMAIVDGLESLPQMTGLSASSIATLRNEALARLADLSSSFGSSILDDDANLDFASTPTTIAFGGFGISKGMVPDRATGFQFHTPTTRLNTMRVLRACQLPKAILLEGNPGVGKTSLVSALASVSDHKLNRINLSDQTDLIDLFGSDLPVDGGAPGEFQWRDAAFLSAMQEGDWVLLDEMNLASQTVLEGLNAVLDHRGTVFIPELGKTFNRHPDFRIFSAQNPHQQGGGRKGLPKSFLNRFTKVYLQEQTVKDLETICGDLFIMPEETIRKMVKFNEIIRHDTTITRSIGRQGSPWEFNLRDLFRWFELLAKRNGLERSPEPDEFVRMLYLHRFRETNDHVEVMRIFSDVFERDIDMQRATPWVTPEWIQIGHSLMPRSSGISPPISSTFATEHLDLAQSVLKAADLGWLVILPGPSGAGKRDLIQTIATTVGQMLGEFNMHPGVDASEMLGSFEQQDIQRLLRKAYEALVACLALAAEISSDEVVDPDTLVEMYGRCSSSPDGSYIAAFLNKSQEVLTALPPGINTTAARSALEAAMRCEADAKGFTWADGEFVDTLRNGGWFLLSDANLCNASVLDRLNSLCENDGVLVLSEKGSVGGSPEVIKPHENFRLFMTYDPKYGELSRAMRNRGLELYAPTSAKNSDQSAAKSTTASSYLWDHTVLKSIHDHGLDRGGNDHSKLASGIVYQTICGLHLLQCAAESDLLRQGMAWLAKEEVQQFIKKIHQYAHADRDLPASFCGHLVSIQASRTRAQADCSRSLSTSLSTLMCTLVMGSACSDSFRSF